MELLNNKFIYFPVNSRTDPNAFAGSETCLANALRPTPSRYLNAFRKKQVMCDSGGLQVITKGFAEEKTILIGPMFKTEIQDPDFLTIGLLSNCQEYRRLGSVIGFCVDVPSGPGDSDFVFYRKLGESIKARNHTLKLAKYVCPGTELGIVLQPRNPSEVAQYFGLISTPKVGLYAYPARNRLKDAMGNAYILSFLHSVGVRHVHFLGSSAVSVIILLAKAVASEIFARCTFDSLTWNQAAVGQGYRYLCPETLVSMPRKASLPSDANLSWELEKYSLPFSQFQEKFNSPLWMSAKEWQGIWNIHAIEYFKNSALRQIKNGMTSKLLPQSSRGKRRDQIIAALNLLDESKAYGHRFVEDKYLPMLLEQQGECF